MRAVANVPETVASQGWLSSSAFEQLLRCLIEDRLIAER